MIITRKRDQAVVMMSIEETSYLLRVPANAQRLQASIRSLEAGGGNRAQNRRDRRRMKLLFSEQVWEDYRYWLGTDKKIAKRINQLIRDTALDPFQQLCLSEGVMKG